MRSNYERNANWSCRACANPARIVCLLLVFATSCLAQTGRAESRAAKAIEELLSKVGVSVSLEALSATFESSIEARIRWNAYVSVRPYVPPGGAQATPGGGFVVSQVRRVSEKPVVPRSPELSEDQLLVAAVDGAGQLRGFAIVHDPRILRAEEPGPTNELKGQVLHHTTPEFLVSLPDDPAITALRFYLPRWSGQAFALEMLGAAPLRRQDR